MHHRPSYTKEKVAQSAAIIGALLRSEFLMACLGVLITPIVVAQESNTAPRYVIDAIEVVGNTRTETELILNNLLLTSGDFFSEKLAERSRVRLLGTGLFTDVSMRLKKGSERGHVIWLIEVSERNTLLVSDIYITTSREVPVLVGFGLAEQNLLGKGYNAEGAFIAGTDLEGSPELGLKLRAESPPIGDFSYSPFISALYLNASDFFGASPGRQVFIDELPEPQTFARLRYQRRGGEVGVSRDAGALSRLVLGLRVEQIVADLPQAVSAPIGQNPDQRINFFLEDGKTQLIALYATFLRDTRDDPFLPSMGSRLFLQGTLGTQVVGGSYNYGRFEVGAARWKQTSNGNVLKGEVYSGLILGDAPFFERFYIGDLSDVVPDRQLEIAPSVGGSPDLFNSGMASERYADVALRLGGEYAMPLRKNTSDGVYIYGMQAYVGGGVFAMASRQELLVKDVSRPFGIPIDITFDAGLRIDTLVGVFGLSFSNAIGIIP
jgi:outer membrane protein insertion porin family